MGARLLLRWMVDQAKVKAFVADCRRHVAGELRDDLYTRVLYSTDASLYQVMPHAVVIPRTIEDVIAAVALAAEYGLPVLPRGAGTSLAGQAVNEALIIDFTRHLDAIVEINPDERWVRVQPGVVVDDLNASLRPAQLAIRPRSGQQRPLDRRRDGRQQRHRQPLPALWHDGGSRSGDGGGAGRRIAARAAALG